MNCEYDWSKLLKIAAQPAHQFLMPLNWTIVHADKLEDLHNEQFKQLKLIQLQHRPNTVSFRMNNISVDYFAFSLRITISIYVIRFADKCM